MKHSGKAAWAALRLIGFAGAGVLAVLLGALLAKYIGSFVLEYLTWVLVGFWGLFAIFTFIFSATRTRWCPPVPTSSLRPATGRWM